MVCLLSGLDPLEESVDDSTGVPQVRDFSKRCRVMAGVRHVVGSRIRPADGNESPGTVGEENEQRALPAPVIHYGQYLFLERMSLACDDDRDSGMASMWAVWGDSNRHSP